MEWLTVKKSNRKERTIQSLPQSLRKVKKLGKEQQEKGKIIVNLMEV